MSSSKSGCIWNKAAYLNFVEEGFDKISRIALTNQCGRVRTDFII